MPKVERYVIGTGNNLLPILMPPSAVILSVGCPDPLRVVAYARVDDPREHPLLRFFRVIRSGQACEADWTFVGTAHFGSVAWHVFQVPPPGDD